MNVKPKTLIVSIAIPLIIGAVAGIISNSSMESFAAKNTPPFSPPGWLFPIVWTILYVLMGIASYLVFISDAPKRHKKTALILYVMQLVFNFLWPIIFFNFELYYFAFAWLIVLWFLVILTITAFYRVSKTAAYLLIPYIIWITFAVYLNLSIAILNIK